MKSTENSQLSTLNSPLPKGPLWHKSVLFALRIVKLAKFLQGEKKEANETDYWLDLLHQSDYLTQDSYASIHPDIQELIKLLVSIVKTSKGVKHGS